jgi:hypothetical protein
MLEIPVHQDLSARYSMEIALDGTIYELDFSWNTREATWYMDILNSDGSEMILMGLKLVPNYRILAQYRHLIALPPGEILLVDQSQDNQNSVVTYDNFGSRYKLLYVTKAEVPVGV